MVNYKRELRIEIDIRQKKMEKLIEFAEQIKKVQEEMKQQANSERKETEAWKVGDKIMLSMKDLVFKELPVKKLVDQYTSSYIIDKVVSINAIKI